MAISQQAAQQVAALLTQSLGLPGGQGAEIAQRLLGGAGGEKVSRSARMYGPNDAISQAVRSQFTPREQPRPETQRGRNGKDGTAGQGGRNGVSGADGSAGLDGAAGADGVVDYDAIRKYLEGLVNGLIPGGGGGYGDGLDDLRRKLQDALDRISRLERRADNNGKCFGQDICGVLKKQAIDLKQTARKVQELEDKFKKFDKRVEAIEAYMPPEECS
jgi:hypothetical protein